MSGTRSENNLMAVTAYVGDAKTLLAFDLTTDSARIGLAGFSIQVHPPGAEPYYLDNNLRLAPSPAHAQVTGESPFSTANAPIRKFRWVHVPGLVHQGGSPAFGVYTYVVTPPLLHRGRCSAAARYPRRTRRGRVAEPGAGRRTSQLDSLATNAKAVPGTLASTPTANTSQAAVNAGWFLGTTDAWAQKYFDPNDLHCVDRRLFGDQGLGPQ